MRCYTQDLVHEDANCGELEELDMTVLDHPRGFLNLNESTVVFSVELGAVIRWIVADIVFPALIMRQYL